MSEKWITCKKCGALARQAVLLAMEYKRCPSCDEPDPQYHDLDRADWSTPVIEQGEKNQT